MIETYSMKYQAPYHDCCARHLLAIERVTKSQDTLLILDMTQVMNVQEF